VLQLAAAAERFSEHPIGRSVVQASREKALALGEPREFSVLPGYGVAARVDGYHVLIGNRSLLQEQSIHWPSELDSRVKAMERQGQTVISVAIDGSLAGLIALADTARPEAKAAIAELKRLGVAEVIMITGDNAQTAASVASELGIDRFYAEVLPRIS
jgi:P-type E1-E2 ATPase